MSIKRVFHLGGMALLVLIMGMVALACGGNSASSTTTLSPMVTASEAVSPAASESAVAAQTDQATATPTATAVQPATSTEPTPSRTSSPTTQPSTAPATETPTGTPRPTAVATGDLKVHFIDVGQGDTILIQAPDGSTALIDGGESGSGALQYLQSQGVEHLDLMVATHPHADHIGGLAEVLGAIAVAKVVTNGDPHTTATYEHFLDAIANAKAQYIEVRRGDPLALGGLTLSVLSPPAPGAFGDLNQDSVMLSLQYGQMTFLFMGDAGKEAEAGILGSGLPVGATILKVGHHGSSSASSPAFLGAVRPQVAVYSAGLGNDYGHPHKETLLALAAVGAQVYGTDVNGTVVVTSDGNTYSTSTAKGNGPRAPPAGNASIEATEQVQPAYPPPPTSAVAVENSLEIVSVTSPVSPGAHATLSAETAPGANCSITVYYKSGPSKAQGLAPKVADANGAVSWTWMVGTRTTPGTWRIVVTAEVGGNRLTKEISLVVQ